MQALPFGLVGMSDSSPLPSFFGRSPALAPVRLFLRRAADVDASVLIQGETGTGKSLLARHLHRASRRSAGPFVSVNCAGLPEGLFESELFGHARGAFTGAHADREGLVVSAEGGTLFLDEIGELPGPQQAKLLSAIEDRRIRPVGASQAIAVDFRLVSATCRQLAEDRDAGRFRADLYHRIALLTLTLPPLRDRPNDIVPLARRFLASARERHGLPDLLLDPDARDLLEGHPWPGNVRQLAHVIEAAAILAPSERIRRGQLLRLLEPA